MCHPFRHGFKKNSLQSPPPFSPLNNWLGLVCQDNTSTPLLIFFQKSFLFLSSEFESVRSIAVKTISTQSIQMGAQSECASRHWAAIQLCASLRAQNQSLRVKKTISEHTSGRTIWACERTLDSYLAIHKFESTQSIAKSWKKVI